MSEIDPIEEQREALEHTLSKARRELGRLRGKANFSDALEQITRRQAALGEHRASLEKLRGRGYVWRPELEEALSTAAGEVDGLLGTLREEARHAEQMLRERFERADRMAARIRGDVLDQEGEIRALEDMVEGTEDAVEEYESKLKALARPFQDRVDGLARKLKDLHWTCDQFDDASFDLRPEENVLAAAEALWEDAPGDDDGVPGRLMFTDLRVRFEQKEEVVTKKKFFFFAAEKELQQGLFINEPVGHLLASDDSTRGMVFKDQLLTLRWHDKAQAPSTTTFKLSSGSAKDWDEVVEMLMSGEITRFRVDGDAAAGAAGAPVDWPRSCRGCGSAMPAPVKGQTVLACPYCGTEHGVTLA